METGDSHMLWMFPRIAKVGVNPGRAHPFVENRGERTAVGCGEPPMQDVHVITRRYARFPGPPDRKLDLRTKGRQRGRDQC
jgi:hypothetical protein